MPAPRPSRPVDGVYLSCVCLTGLGVRTTSAHTPPLAPRRGRLSQLRVFDRVRGKNYQCPHPARRAPACTWLSIDAKNSLLLGSRYFIHVQAVNRLASRSSLFAVVHTSQIGTSAATRWRSAAAAAAAATRDCL